jgi:anti-sigma regulatory factor (Ser/Thr protein kinase)
MEFVSYDIASRDFGSAGAASRSIKEHLRRIGAEAEVIRRAMIAAYEAEMNVVIHADGGRLEASLSDTRIDVNVIDNGPGIADIELAMSEGFSTASAEARALGFGAGMGLPNIRRNSDRLRVTSKPGEGTRVSFTVYLKPQTGSMPRAVSLCASAERCQECASCLKACPTRAKRVRMGRPSVIEHLCVECTACIGACGPHAWTICGEVASLADITNRQDKVLAVPPALLAGCGSSYSPAHVLEALETLGFAEVVSVGPFEEELLESVLASTGTPPSHGAAPGGAQTLLPLIAPSCPAVVNLVELRFPSLVPQLAPFESPWEALQATYADHAVVYVVSCPSQRSALLSHDQARRERRRARSKAQGQKSKGPTRIPARTQAEYLIPEVVREAVRVRLGDGGKHFPPRQADDARSRQKPVAWAGDSAIPPTRAKIQPEGRVLTVTGMDHAITVLEDAENGLLEGLAVIDLYACEGGCFGSPLLAEDHHVTRHRWELGREEMDALERARGRSHGTPRPAATARRDPYAPRPGIRLDPDMSRALEKLERMQAVIRALPGRDCGACGAPTCAAFAEDVVMERAAVDLCPFAGEGKEQAE